MPGVISGIVATTYDRTSSFPQQVWDAFASHPRDSNVIYPHAQKCLANEKNGAPIPDGQFWITCSSNQDIDLVISCTQNSLGKYPLFIISTHPIASLTYDFLYPRLLELTSALIKTVPLARVYSVFAPDPIARLFAHMWTTITGIQYYESPYYAAKLTHCTKASYVERSFAIHTDLAFEIRPALPSDIMEVAPLCYGFAAESEPFVLTIEEAFKEASILIQSGQLWIHRVCRPNQVSEVASIVAVTRASDTVAAITKVYTNPNWRRRGCAERLVRRVTNHLLLSEKKESVVLYVAHNNPAAANVYSRVGFAGLNAESPPVEGVDSWLELGFDRFKVELGHW